MGGSRRRGRARDARVAESSQRPRLVQPTGVHATCRRSRCPPPQGKKAGKQAASEPNRMWTFPGLTSPPAPRPVTCTCLTRSVAGITAPKESLRRLGAVCLQRPLLISCPNSPRIEVRASEDHGVSRCSARRGGLQCRWSSETVRWRPVPNDSHYGMWSACREVFDDHLPGPGVLQLPRRELVNGMGRGPRAALIGPVTPQRPRTLLPRRVLCEF
jgi:hypothetical protein